MTRRVLSVVSLAVLMLSGCLVNSASDGDRVRHFDLMDTEGHPVRSQEISAPWVLSISVRPTPECGRELEDLVQAHTEPDLAGLTLVTIIADYPGNTGPNSSHAAAVKENCHADWTFAADAAGSVSRDYVEDSHPFPYHGYIVSPDGTLYGGTLCYSAACLRRELQEATS